MRRADEATIDWPLRMTAHQGSSATNATVSRKEVELMRRLLRVMVMMLLRQPQTLVSYLKCPKAKMVLRISHLREVVLNGNESSGAKILSIAKQVGRWSKRLRHCLGPCYEHHGALADGPDLVVDR